MPTHARKFKPSKRVAPHSRLQSRRMRRTRKTNGARPSGPFKSFNTTDPFPVKMYKKLHYSENHVLATGAFQQFGAEQIYRCNSVWDPDQTSTGHQPYGMDQLEILYRKYKVTAILLELTWTDPSEDGLSVGICFQPPGSGYSLTGKSPQTLREQPMSITRSINNTGSQKGSIKQYFPISTLSGLTNLQFKADVDLFTAPVAENPPAVPLLRFAVASDRNTQSATIIFQTKITYYTTFYERKQLNMSS